MHGEPVLRIKFIVFAHERVAVHLGEDARRADGVRERVPPHDVLLRQIDAQPKISVHKHHVRLNGKPFQRAVKRAMDAVERLIFLEQDEVEKNKGIRIERFLDILRG